MALSAPASAPYGARDAAERLGVSRDLIEKHYAALGGIKLGSKLLIPRHVVDALCEGPEAGTPAVERVLSVLPALSKHDRVRVASAALQGAA
jgi:hypothetical protein